MKYVGYYNGEIGPLEEMKIPMLDRAVYFGDGCYDATTFANNNIFAADDHLDRFYNSCKLLEIPFEMSREELRAELQKCIDANEIDHGMLYWQCSRGTTYRGHQFPPATVKPNLMIFTVPCDLIPFDKTFRLISMEDTRFLHCNIKTLNLIPSVIAYQRCIEQGYQETVFHRGERVTECAHSNILIIKDGVLCTPPRDNLILPGTERKHIIRYCGELGIPVEREIYQVYRSLPGEASIRIQVDSSEAIVPLTPYVYSGTAENLEAELVFDRISATGGCSQKEQRARMAEFAGKIVLTYENSFAFACEAKRAGVLGVITIWHADLAHHGTLGGVWGTPEPEDLACHYPRIPFVEITKSAGKELQKKLEELYDAADESQNSQQC